jgi:hypothetical protein
LPWPLAAAGLEMVSWLLLLLLLLLGPLLRLGVIAACCTS